MHKRVVKDFLQLSPFDLAEIKARWAAYAPFDDLQLWGRRLSKVWKATPSQKINFLLWRLALGSLSVRSRLDRWLNIPLHCTLYKMQKERVLHLFWDCHMVRRVWKAIYNWLEDAQIIAR